MISTYLNCYFNTFQRIIFALLLVATALFPAGCDKSTKVDNQISEAHKKQFAERMKKSKEAKKALGSVAFRLLALKYEVNLSKVMNMIEEYNATIKKIKKESSPFQFVSPDEKPRSESQLPPSEQIDNLIDTLHVKYNIPKNKLAGILIDYKIMTDSESAAIDCRDCSESSSSD